MDDCKIILHWQNAKQYFKRSTSETALGIFHAYTTRILFRFIAPLLVLGVGVDDGFLMMHNWFTSKEFDSFLRLRSMLITTGPSISLTSLTNFCAFLVCFSVILVVV